MRARIRGKGKPKKSVRTNWRKTAFENMKSLSQVRNELAIANGQLRSAREGEEQARSKAVELTEMLEAANQDVLRLSAEVEEKTQRVLQSIERVMACKRLASVLASFLLETESLPEATSSIRKRATEIGYQLPELLRPTEEVLCMSVNAVHGLIFRMANEPATPKLEDQITEAITKKLGPGVQVRVARLAFD